MLIQHPKNDSQSTQTNIEAEIKTHKVEEKFTADEKIDAAATLIIKLYRKAFEELAK